MLELEGLCRRFGDVVALDDVSFTVEKGEILGFVGRNGAGKTTTMRIALGLLASDRGAVRFDGHEPTAEDHRRHFGYLPEERGLYPKMAAREQLRYIGRLSGLTKLEAADATDEWLERLGVADRADAAVDELSLGNQQRVQLAAAVLHRPDVLVLDEPFSGLDPVGVDVLADALLAEVRRGAAVVFSSHQLELVERLCRRVAIIDGGRLVAYGSIDDLRAARSWRRIQLEVDTDGCGWLRDVPGVLAVEREHRRTVVELADDADDQAVLAAARRAGPVHHFSVVEPSLTELFREVVAS